jgi:hypothetical protein
MEMKVDIPDDILQKVTLRAAQEGVTLKELVARALQKDLAQEFQPPPAKLTPQERFLRMSRAERAQAFLEESKLMTQFYAEHPNEVIPDFFDEADGKSQAR